MLPFSIDASKALVLALAVTPTLGLFVPDVEPRDDNKYLAMKIDVKRPKNIQDAIKQHNSAAKSKYVASLSPGIVVQDLVNDGVQYNVDILVGSNKDKLTVSIDTGSSDLNIVDTTAQCSFDCKKYGAFDSGSSSTFQDLQQPVHLVYGKGNSDGKLVKDTFQLVDNPNVVINNFEFIDVYNATFATGILGVGYDVGEQVRNKYPGFVTELKNNGYIKKNAYSLYLDELNTHSGQVIFGGVDNKKYYGKLTTYKSDPNRLAIPLKSLHYGDDTFSGDDHLSILDSGTTLSIINLDLWNQLAQAANLTDVSDHYQLSPKSFYATSCNSPDFVFDFGNGGQITVPFNSVSYPTVGTPKEENLCTIAFQPNNLAEQFQQFNILGDNFLRNAYVVYDLEDQLISIAQTKYTNESEIVPL